MSKKSRYKNKLNKIKSIEHHIDLSAPNIHHTVGHTKIHKLKSKVPNIWVILVTFYLLTFLIFSGYHWYYADRIVSKVYIDNIDFSKKTVDEAISILKNKNKVFESLNLKFGDKSDYTFKPSDVNFEYLPIDTVKDAYAVGRDDPFLLGIPSKYQAFVHGVYIKSYYRIDDQKLNDFVNNIAEDVEIELVEPKFILNEGVVSIQKGVNGLTIDKELLKKELVKRIIFNDKSDLVVKINEHRTELSDDDLKKLVVELKNITSIDHVVKYMDKTWPIKKEDLISLLEVRKNESDVRFIPNSDLAKKLITNIAEEVNTTPRGLNLEIKDKKVVNFTSSVEGVQVDIDKSAKNLIDNILDNQKGSDLVVNITKPPSTTNEYGIEELLAEGSSKFKGSIANRVHNVGLASSRVEGALVPPGEVFSFNGTVGKIDQSTGYKTAYVISKGRTILGDGGGVCQVSTTLFRAALNAGLPIVSRTAHAYRVGYYEQNAGPGLDATVYSPTVDFKFKNDTKSYIYIAREFDPKAMTLVFKFYGKKDNREVEISKPEMVTKIAPPPTIYEEDGSLDKGKRIQTEHSVWGGLVKFSRTIKYNGEEQTETFKSNYRPWPDVFKVGTR